MATSGIDQSGGERQRIGDAILIAGPTASGKSALALRVAEALGGVVVNTDAMQVYGILDVLTARPRPAELARVPHVLYGHVHPGVAYSTGAFLRDVEGLAGAGLFARRRPVFVGGTGLYFRALLEGLSAMPDIPQGTRDRWRYRLNEEGPDRLHRILRREDPEAARQLNPMDGQRIVRALEVLETSGRSILAWRATREAGPVDPATATRILVMPDSAELAGRIDRRAADMLAGEAEAEVRALLALGLDPSLPAMKAIGVPEIAAFVDGRHSAQETLTRLQAATRQYAKRQRTWFRNQTGPHWHRVDRVNDAMPAVATLFGTLG